MRGLFNVLKTADGYIKIKEEEWDRLLTMLSKNYEINVSKQEDGKDGD